ncbi:tRNA lysidine(34) synthetase TilS, partial [Xanthomonas oryzae]|uniref:tRNA lysidine(34) synthetase TilS n=20 Tax=Xanthomonas TaxID=338 RepID=UPI000DDB4C4D
MLTDTPLRLPAIPPGPVLLAYSGGMDSSALLQLLAATPRYRQAGLRALHVHHGLHADADAWAAHCQRSCDALQVPLQIVRVQVERDSGLGLEAAARNARHIAFAHTLAAGEWLTLAHHRDDQAETFLLRALRASGQEGLAAMRPQRPFADGTLWRPLLAHSRADLLAYALAQEVRWIEDPSNADPRHDRNFLRSQVLPLLQQRWPQAADALARSAQLSADASALLLQQDMALLPSVCTASGALDLHALRAQPIERRARLLRAWVSAAHAPPLPAQGVAALEREID